MQNILMIDLLEKIMGPANKWAETPELFARWAYKLLTDDMKTAYYEFIKENNKKFKIHGKWLWSSIFYLRRKSEYSIYISGFNDSLKIILADQPDIRPDKNWDDYLAYCKACIEIIQSTGYPIEFLDIILSLCSRHIKRISST